jgi:hypothetical protein
MPVMPYAIEKGPVCEAFERYLDHPGHRTDFLALLRDTTRPIWECAAFEGVMIGRETAADHLRIHWFGDPEYIDGEWTIKRKVAPNWWMRNWHGEPEQITRETLRRAVEVAGGVSREETESRHFTGKMPRHWPIEVFITCGAEQFQGFVTWRNNVIGGEGGHVTIIMSATKYGPTSYHYYSGIRSERQPPPPDYREHPDHRADIEAAQGMWVVGHLHGQRPKDYTHSFESSGPISTARMAEADGGVAADVGRVVA